MLRNWHSYSLEPQEKKNVESKTPGLGRGFRRGKQTVLKRHSACAQRLIKYSSSEGDQVFLLPLELSPFLATFLRYVVFTVVAR